MQQDRLSFIKKESQVLQITWMKIYKTIQKKCEEINNDKSKNKSQKDYKNWNVNDIYQFIVEIKDYNFDNDNNSNDNDNDNNNDYNNNNMRVEKYSDNDNLNNHRLYPFKQLKYGMLVSFIVCLIAFFVRVLCR